MPLKQSPRRGLSSPPDCSSTQARPSFLRVFFSFLMFVCLGTWQLVSEVEVLQVDGAQCACEQVEVFLREIHGAIQGALQAG